MDEVIVLRFVELLGDWLLPENPEAVAAVAVIFGRAATEGGAAVHRCGAKTAAAQDKSIPRPRSRP